MTFPTLYTSSLHVLRPLGALLLGAMALNCTVATDGSDPVADEAQSSDDVERTLIAVVDAPEQDPTRSHYEIHAVDDDAAVELRGFSNDMTEVSRVRFELKTDLEDEPWVQLDVDDEELAFSGHLRTVDAKGRTWLELDAEVNDQVVALRVDPEDPLAAEIYGFPGAPEGEFSLLIDYDDAQGLAGRFMTVLARLGALQTGLEQAPLVRETGALDFRGVGCISCIGQAAGSLALSGACIAAIIGTVAACSGGPLTAGPCALGIATVGVACGQAVIQFSDFFDSCQGA
ncbi:MAG: hypothetical protein K0V04_13585 [Deltaproteobacteria bacterium]|nr:hypothetical protein [Deltaproteobacteria bacterium]